IDLEKTYTNFLDMADRIKEVQDEDLKILMGGKLQEQQTGEEGVSVKLAQIMTGNPLRPTATVVLNFHGEEKEATATGNGPVNATFNAIHKIIGDDIILKDFGIRAIHGGSDDISKVSLRVEYKGKTHSGYGYHTDII